MNEFSLRPRAQTGGWRWLSLLAGLGALTACDEAVAPAGQPADVPIRVYVDRDNSGTFSPADSGLAGVALALVATNDPSVTLAATSDAQGLATFPAVAPGAYTVTVPATAPAGTVLTTAATPRVTVSAIGEVRAAEVRYGWLPAAITGRIYRDDNSDGVFGTGDTPGAGLFAVLLRGTTRVDSVTADAEGRFGFQFLAPGTYTVRLENPATITFTDGAERTVTVAAGASGTVDSRFTGALVIPIAEARARALNSVVAVVGNLTVRPGRFTSGTGGSQSEVWVQDATGGIAAFFIPTADSAQYQLGDRLEVSGARSAFSQQAQITISRVRNLGAGTVPAPVQQSVAQAKAFTREGQVVRVSNLTIVNIPTGTGAAFTVRAIDAASDTLDLRIAGLGTGLTRASFTLGQRYTVTGVLTRFNTTPQIKIREASDVVQGTPVSTIASVRSTGVNGTSYTITGRLTTPPAVFPSGTNNVNSEIWVQDATGGIAVFSVPTADSTTLTLGSLVEVTGSRGAFSGQLQLGTPSVALISAGAPPAAVDVTAADVAARTLEGQLVRLAGFTVTSVPTGTGAAFTVNGTVAGQPIQVRVAGALRGLSRASFTVGTTYTVTGILTQFNGTSQIKVRFASDVTP